MSEMDLEPIKKFLADAYDADEIVGVLKIESWELLDAFEDKVEEYANGNVDDEAYED